MSGLIKNSKDFIDWQPNAKVIKYGLVNDDCLADISGGAQRFGQVEFCHFDSTFLWRAGDVSQLQKARFDQKDPDFYDSGFRISNPGV